MRAESPLHLFDADPKPKAAFRPGRFKTQMRHRQAECQHHHNRHNKRGTTCKSGTGCIGLQRLNAVCLAFGSSASVSPGRSVRKCEQCRRGVNRVLNAEHCLNYVRLFGRCWMPNRLSQVNRRLGRDSATARYAPMIRSSKPSPFTSPALDTETPE